MTGRRPRLLAAAAIALAIGVRVGAQQPGNATISGTVINGVSQRPVASAAVTARAPGGAAHRASTDAAGHFTLAGLPPGHYHVTASATGAFPGEFGQETYGGPSRLVLGEPDEIRGDVTVPVWPPAAIHGRVLDTGGAAVLSRVWLLRRDETWDQSWMPARPDPIATGADGRYSFDALEPGRYAVVAWPPSGAGVTTFAPTFAPAATRGADLVAIAVDSGVERDDADVTVRPRSIITISGHLIGAPDQFAGTTVRACPTDPVVRSLGWCAGEARASADGAFRIAGVPAGNYMIEAQRARANRAGIVAWGHRAVSLGAGTDSADIQMHAPFALSGVAASGNGAESAAGALVGVRTLDALLVPIDSRSQSDPIQAIVGPDGHFVIDGLPPGEYVYSDEPGSTFTLLSAMAGGRDAADEPISLDEGVQPPPAVVTLTRAAAAVTGVVRSETGQAEAEVTVWLFPVEPHLWLPKSRRVQAGRTGVDGSFAFGSLPPGDYYVSADPDPARRLTRAALEAAVARSRKIQVAAGARLQIDLTLPAR